MSGRRFLFWACATAVAAIFAFVATTNLLALLEGGQS